VISSSPRHKGQAGCSFILRASLPDAKETG